MADTLSAYTYAGMQQGLHLLLLGGVHGNEICGTAALAHLKLELDLGLTVLTRGTLTIVPVANPAAYRAGERFIDNNLNRIIAHWPQPAFPEQAYADQLARLIEAADIVLDLHSYSAGTIPYVFLDYPTPDNMRFASSLGLQHSLVGWPALYEQENHLSMGDTILHAHRSGKAGLLIECGNHNDPASLAIATSVTRHALIYCNLIEGTPETLPQSTWRVEQVRIRDKEGAFSRPWNNLDEVTCGTPLIDFADGSVFCAPYDGAVILPNKDATPGHEWIYFGHRVSG